MSSRPLHSETHSPKHESVTPVAPVVAADTAHVPSRHEQMVGAVLVFMVAVIWTFSGELTKYVFDGSSSGYDKPYMLTYYSVSLCTLLLCGFARRKGDGHWRWRAVDGEADVEEELEVERGEGVRTKQAIGVGEVGRIGVQLAPIFFFSSWMYNYGLRMTSVASSSTIASLTTVFALGLGVAMKSVKLRTWKVVATVMAVLGVGMISQQDRMRTVTSANGSYVLGDTISIVSALIYALYTVVLDQHLQKWRLPMWMMLGFMGLATLVLFWPGLIVLSVMRWETLEMPGLKIAGILTLNGLIGTVGSDFLWAKGVELAGPMISTLSLSLSVPMSLVADVVIRGEKFGGLYMVGTGLVVGSFLVMNADLIWERGEKLELERDSGERVSDEG